MCLRQQGQSTDDNYYQNHYFQDLGDSDRELIWLINFSHELLVTTSLEQTTAPPGTTAGTHYFQMFAPSEAFRGERNFNV